MTAYTPPDPDVVLVRDDDQADPAEAAQAAARVAERLDETLASFGVDAKVTDHARGAAVTRYKIVPGQGVRVDAITKLQRDLALAVAAPDVRILAPVPGESVVGVEVPNDHRDVVPLRDMLDRPPVDMTLPLPIGTDVEGAAIWADLAKLPHLLVAGTTGSGKSVWLNCALVSLVLHSTPDRVRFVLIDPKQVELEPFADLPHVRQPVVTKANKAARALEHLVDEMETRYTEMRRLGARTIDEARDKGADWPHVVVVIDEMADLMMTTGKRVEDAVVRLGQKARAAGIHMILATQRPITKVVTGLIKGNVPARLCFAVPSHTDSMVALDRSGAQALAGKGDALFLSAGMSTPERVQSPFVSLDEVYAVVDHYRVETEAIEREQAEMAARLAAEEEDEEDEVEETAEIPVVATPTADDFAREIDHHVRRVAAETGVPALAAPAPRSADALYPPPPVPYRIPDYARYTRPLASPVQPYRPQQVGSDKLTAGDIWAIVGIAVATLGFSVLLLPVAPVAVAALAATWYGVERKRWHRQHRVTYNRQEAHR